MLLTEGALTVLRTRGRLVWNLVLLIAWIMRLVLQREVMAVVSGVLLLVSLWNLLKVSATVCGGWLVVLVMRLRTVFELMLVERKMLILILVKRRRWMSLVMVLWTKILCLDDLIGMVLRNMAVIRRKWCGGPGFS